MHRKLAVLLSLVLGVLLFAGCTDLGSKTYMDGTYYAEYVDFDSYGYKDYLWVTVEDGAVKSIEYNGKNEDGLKKTDDEKYQSEMQAVLDTYPRKYTADMVNQYLEKQDIDAVDTLAGATYSFESFKALFLALEPQMVKGDTTAIAVPNIPVK